MYKMSMTDLFVLIGCLSASLHGYKVLLGEDDTDCRNNPGLAVVQPGSGCKQFLLCNLEGLAFGPMDCAHGTLFDRENQTCLRSKDVDCLDPVDVTLPECATAAVPGYCQQYTQCVWGIQLFRDCGNFTVYSNSLHVCVHVDSLTDQERQGCRL